MDEDGKSAVSQVKGYCNSSRTTVAGSVHGLQFLGYCSLSDLPFSRSFCLKSLTALYALILTIVAFIIEMSPTWQSESMNIEYTIFCVLMYSIAIAYFIYLYTVVLYPVVFNTVILYMERCHLLSIESLKKMVRPEAVYTGEGAGTLYLRLGTLSK